MPFSNNKEMRKVIIACMIGNALEWYDFVIYGYFAIILGKLFFPNGDPVAQLIATFGVFWIGFIARPLGGIVFGHIGDKFSRKTALAITIYLMAIPTTLIGCLPTYEHIGWWAPLLLIILRFLQGLALGGEFTGSIIFLIEHANPKKQGFAGSFASCSLVIGVIIGSSIATALMAFLNTAELESWGWRIPFLISILGSLIGSYMIKYLTDPQAYLKEKAKLKSESFPIKTVLQNFKPQITLIIFIDFLTAIGFFMLVIFFVTYFKTFLNLPNYLALSINTFSMVIFCVSTLLGGWLSDRYNKNAILAYPCIFFICASYPLFLMFQHGVLGILIAQSTIALAMGIFFGTIPVVLTKIFPSEVRFSGVSFAHNISMAIFGGSTPLLSAKLIHTTGSTLSPAILLIAAAALSLVGLLCYSRNSLKLRPNAEPNVLVPTV